MRDKSSVILIRVLAVFALSGISAAVFSDAGPTPDDPPTLVRSSPEPHSQQVVATPATLREWFASIRP